MENNSVNTVNQNRLKKIIILNYRLKLLSGLRIGGLKEELKIGDIDHPVIRDPITNVPYIPGSSLKGKMRASLEIALYGIDKPCSCGSCNICRLFGASARQISRLIVRDAFMSENSKNLLLDQIGDYVEIKMENIINRVKGNAEHPRTLDRIPAGVEFDCEFVLRLYEDDLGKENDYINMIKTAIALIEHTYLGGSGTRGYGKVKFEEAGRKVYSIEDDGNGFIEINLIPNGSAKEE